MRAEQTLKKFLAYHFETVLDIGSGAGYHAAALRSAGRAVTTISLQHPADIVDDYMHRTFTPFDAIWCCHVLEHQPDAGLFLKKMFRDLKHNGTLAITVPVLQTKIKGGHLSLWTPGQLVYNLIVAGFDCSQAMVKQYDVNISVVLEKKTAELPSLEYNRGDIERIAPFYPIAVGHNDDSQFDCRW